MKSLCRFTLCGLCLLAVTSKLAANPNVAEPAPTTSTSDTAARWTDLLDQKKALDKEVAGKIDALRTRSQNVSPQKKQEIMNEFEQLQAQYINKYEALFSNMRPLASQLDYKANPAAVAPAENLMQVTFQENRFAQAAAIADRLIASDNASPEVFAVGGLSHYADHQFSEAQKLLSRAKQENASDPRIASFLAAATAYPALWEKEQALRRDEVTADENPQVLFKTPRGDILLELFEDQAPNTVANFIDLVDSGFYNGIAFHRVLPGFMAQGGDPNSKDEDPRNDGSGGPGYTIACECTRPDTRMHFAGSLSMAHAGKDTGGSQFFITHLPTDHLNGRHTVFGRVIEGLPTARGLRPNDTIESATVVRKRDHPYKPQTTKK